MTQSSQPQLQTQHPASSVGTVLGIVALVCGILGLIPSFGILLAIVGLFLGWLARRRSRAVGNSTGITLGLIGMILSSVTLVIALVAILSIGSLVGWFNASASVGKFEGRYECEGLNFYEVRQDALIENSRTLTDITVKAEGDNKLRISSVTGGITIEFVGGQYLINGRNCNKYSS